MRGSIGPERDNKEARNISGIVSVGFDCYRSLKLVLDTAGQDSRQFL